MCSDNRNGVSALSLAPVHRPRDDTFFFIVQPLSLRREGTGLVTPLADATADEPTIQLNERLCMAKRTKRPKTTRKKTAKKKKRVAAKSKSKAKSRVLVFAARIPKNNPGVMFLGQRLRTDEEIAAHRRLIQREHEEDKKRRTPGDSP